MRKSKLSAIVLTIIFLLPLFLSGCAQKPEILTKTLAKKLIIEKINSSVFFALPYARATSLNNDKFYMLLLKGGYIKFHKKLGYTSFTPLFKPYLFKKAGRTYIRLGTFKIIKIYNFKFISRKKAKTFFIFKFNPNHIYKLIVKNNLQPKSFTTLKTKNAVAVFQYRPFLEWKVTGFEQAGHKIIKR
ncbi:MAG: hypothetical protein M0Z72_00860 [Deltaproteobacteria bacterium]|nr:hypothetical protein [Deltaproteobacteria bacterium]